MLSASPCDYDILPKRHPISFQRLCFQKKEEYYWSTAESIFDVDKYEDCLFKFFSSACWNFICGSINQKILW